MELLNSNLKKQKSKNCKETSSSKPNLSFSKRMVGSSADASGTLRIKKKITVLNNDEDTVNTNHIINDETKSSDDTVETISGNTNKSSQKTNDMNYHFDRKDKFSLIKSSNNKRKQLRNISTIKNSAKDIPSPCKPCFVVLERLSRNAERNLLSKNNCEESKQRKKHKTRNRIITQELRRSTRAHHKTYLENDNPDESSGDDFKLKKRRLYQKEESTSLNENVESVHNHESVQLQPNVNQFSPICSSDSPKKISEPDVSKEIKSTGIKIENLKNKISSLKHSGIFLEKKSTNIIDSEACIRNPHEDISEPEDSNKNGHDKINFEDSKHNPILLKPSMSWIKRKKRKINHLESDEASVSKPKKFKKKKAAESNDCKKISKDDLISQKSNEVADPNATDTLHNELVCNLKLDHSRKISNLNNTVPVIKNLKVPIVKLDHMQISPLTKKFDSIKPLDRHIKIYGLVSNLKIKTSPFKPTITEDKNINTGKNKKITEYFCPVATNKVLLPSDVKDLKQENIDVILKKKHGISKDVIVSLIDIKELAMPVSRYLTSGTEKLITDTTPNSNTFSVLTNVPPTSSCLNNHEPPSKDDELSTNAEQSSVDSINPLLVDDCVEKPLQNSLRTDTIRSPKKLTPAVVKSLCVKIRSLIKTTKNSTSDNLFLESDELGSKNEEKLIKKLQDAEKVSDEDSSRQSHITHLSEANITTQSSINIDELENHSSMSQVNTTTLKSPKKSNTRVKKLSFSPKSRITLINDNKETIEAQVPEKDNIKKLTKTAGVPEKSSIVPQTEVLNIASINKESAAEPNNTLIVSKNTNSVTNQSDMELTLPSITRSPSEAEKSKSNSKQKKQHFPENIMTVLGLDLLNENDFWQDLNNTIDNITDINTIENSRISELNHCPDVSSNLDNEKIPSKSVENIDNDLPSNTDAEVDKCSEEFTKENPCSFQSLTPNKTKSDSSKQSADINIETDLSEVNTIDKSNVVENKMNNYQCSDSTLKVDLPVNLTDEDSTDHFSSLRIDEDFENSNSKDSFVTDPLQLANSIKNVVETPSEIPSKKNTVQHTSLSGCSVSNPVTQVDQNRDNTEVLSKNECVFCKKTFKHIVGLERHLQVHVRNIACCLCDKTFTKENMTKHYLEHCGYSENTQLELHNCSICDKKFRKLYNLKAHMQAKHSVGKKCSTSKIVSNSLEINKCTVCQLTCNSREELSQHLFKHTKQELQDAYEIAKAKQDLEPITVTTPLPESVSQNQTSEVSENLKAEGTKQIALKSIETKSITSTLPTSNSEISICTCHKDERLEISNGAIIEIALTCKECKTFFKTKKCFKDHYNAKKCKWINNIVLKPTMYCNKCCVISKNLGDMHSHLKTYAKNHMEIKTSFLCKYCNIFYFGRGQLFYSHWFEHCRNPLYTLDHSLYPNNIKIKIVELESSDPAKKIECTESLFIAEHQCQECKKPFLSDADLKKHLNSSVSCGKKIDSSHQVTKSPKILFKLICSICNKEFDNKTTFDTHVNEHDTIKDFSQIPKILLESFENNQLACSICNIKFDTITDYKQHSIKHRIIQEKFVCNSCTLMFDSMEEFEYHAVEHKNTSDKPIVCKVVFSMAKFHCKSCKIWFDTQAMLIKHLVTHNSPKPTEKSSSKITSTVEEKNFTCAKCQQEFSKQIELEAHVSTHKENIPKNKIENPSVIQLFENSDSPEVEIIEDKKNEQKKESSVQNPLLEEEQETPHISNNKKPAFLRVKNLEELLPYSCNTCKTVFSTQTNLNNHVCSQSVVSTQMKTFKYSCTMCKTYQCDNDSDWNLHVLSHYPLRRAPYFNDTLFTLLNVQSNKPILKCKLCYEWRCDSLKIMRLHYEKSHPEIYFRLYKCRVCDTFKTPVEQEIRRHEAGHFQKPGSVPLLTTMQKSSPSLQWLVDNATNVQQTNSSVLGNNSGSNLPPVQLEQDPRNSQVQGSIQSSNLSNNLSPLQVNNFVNYQQPVSNQSVNTNSHNNFSSIQPPLNFNNSQQSSSTSAINNLSNNPMPHQMVANSNKLQQRFYVALQPNLNRNSPLLTSDDNGYNFQQSVPTLTTATSGNNLSSLQTTHTPQLLSTTTEAFKNPVNNDQSLNRFHNTMYKTVSRVRPNPTYYCEICRNFRCSSEEELKVHKSLHETTQSNKSSDKLHECEMCTNFHCNSEELLQIHKEVYHNPAMPNVTENIMKSNTSNVQHKCNYCSKEFVNVTELAKHTYFSHTYVLINEQNQVESQTKYPYTCSVCSIGFFSENHLDVHLKLIHASKGPAQKVSDVRNLFQCSVCHLILISEETLNYHMRSHNMIYQ